MQVTITDSKKKGEQKTESQNVGTQNPIPFFKKQANWVSKSAERNKLLSIFEHGRDKFVTRILRWPYTVV